MICSRSRRGRVISHDPIAQICARHKSLQRNASAAAHNVVAVMDGRSRSVYCAAGWRRDPLVAIVWLEMRVGRITLFALVAHRSWECQNPVLCVENVGGGVIDSVVS